MLILGIETSCDETGVALYDAGQARLVSHAVHSQVAMHEVYGCVVPELASRDHIRRLVPLTRRVLAEGDCNVDDLRGIGYTEGPGLAGALLVGASFARGLAQALGIPALGKVVPRQDQRKCQRVAVALPFESTLLSGKFPGAMVLPGRMRDLSCHGARVELAEALPLYSELRLAFHLPCLDYRVDDAYARVVSMRDDGARRYAGLEFTSLGAQSSSKIELYVHKRLQGECADERRTRQHQSALA